MKKNILKFKTVSFVCLSPRESKAFYKALDFNEEDIKEGEVDEKKVNIIYPFYQYGEYEKGYNRNVEYYIPGSSLKGALLKYDIENTNLRMMVDDSSIKGEDIQLKNLKKFQYLFNRKENKNETSKVQKYGIFLENLGIEMLKPKSTFQTEIYCEIEKVREIIDCTVKSTIERLKNINRYIEELLSYGEIDGGVKKKLEKEHRDIKFILENKKGVIFLGGYKGVIASLHSEWKEKNEPFEKGALYAEEVLLEDNREKLLLPYGLIEIEEVI